MRGNTRTFIVQEIGKPTHADHKALTAKSFLFTPYTPCGVLDFETIGTLKGFQ